MDIPEGVLNVPVVDPLLPVEINVNYNRSGNRHIIRNLSNVVNVEINETIRY